MPTPDDRSESAPNKTPQRVALVEGAVVVDEHQLRESERQGTGEADLERPDDVLLPGTEQDEGTRRDRRDPRPDPVPAHDDAQERAGAEVQRENGELVGDVAAQSEQRPQNAERDDRHGRPMRVVWSEEVVNRGQLGPGEKEEVVAEEPVVRTDTEQHDRDGGDEEDDEDDQRGARTARIGSVGHDLPRWLRVARCGGALLRRHDRRPSYVFRARADPAERAASSRANSSNATSWALSVAMRRRNAALTSQFSPPVMKLDFSLMSHP